MYQAPDYYAVLGVSRDASSEEIRRAYRTLARRCHPDVAHDDPEAEEHFKQITQAYRILSDPDLRARYDRTGSIDGVEMVSDAPFTDVFDLMDSMFGFAFGGRSQVGRAAQARGRDLQIEVTVTLEEVLTGTTREVRYRRLAQCESCNGSGCASGSTPTRCTFCGGTGQVRQVRDAFFGQIATAGLCHRCRGRGYVINNPCPDCHGRGAREKEQTLQVEVPAGVEDGASKVLRGQGHWPAEGQGQPGDLLVRITVAEHPRFVRRGSDLYAELPLNVAQAALGATLEFEGLDGPLEVKVRPGIQGGEEVRLRGRGLPHGQRGRGDLHLIAKIVVPQRLTKRERKLLAELGELWAEGR